MVEENQISKDSNCHPDKSDESSTTPLQNTIVDISDLDPVTHISEIELESDEEEIQVLECLDVDQS